MKFIDIHVHAFMFQGFPRPQNGLTFAIPEELIKRYNELGIEKGCVLPLVSPEARLRVQSPDEVVAIAKKYPDYFIPFTNIDPRFYSNSPKAPLNLMLYYYQDEGCKGVGEVTANLPFTDKMMQNLFKHCSDVGFPLTFHISSTMGNDYGIYDEKGLPLLEKTLKKFSNLIFLGHSQAFWAEIAPIKREKDRKGYPKGKISKPGRVVELMRKYENLHGDLSASSGFNAISRDKEFGIKFLEEFQDRLYFGTDICAPNGKAPLIEYLKDLRKEGAISEEVYRKIARDNAIKLLNL